MVVMVEHGQSSDTILRIIERMSVSHIGGKNGLFSLSVNIGYIVLFIALKVKHKVNKLQCYTTAYVTTFIHHHYTTLLQYIYNRTKLLLH